MNAEPPSVDPPADLAQLHEKTVAINEALIVGSVHQLELANAAQSFNAQLQLEIAAREETARELAEKARLLDLTEDAIIVRDVEGRISYWNHGAEVLFGWSREEAMGKTTHDLLQTESPTPMEQIAQELSTNGRWTGELIHKKRNGQRITVLARKTLDRDREGNPAAVLQTLTDITERKKLEQQALRTQRMESIGTLAGGIAHDLNNSFGPIMMSLDLLRMKVTDPDCQELFAIIDSSAKRGADLVQQVFTFARGVEGERVAQPGTYVMLEVKDSGTGMAPGIVESMFDPFFSTKEVGQGTGLGLSTSLAIVKGHGGFLHVASEPEKGTTFQVFIPAQTTIVSPVPPAPVLEIHVETGK